MPYFTVWTEEVLTAKSFLGSAHRLAKLMWHYERGPLVTLPVVTAIVLTCIIAYKIYRAHIHRSQSCSLGHKARHSAEISGFNFSLLLISASLAGVMIGHALYLMIRER